jgi:hypothetical protein
MHLVHGWMHTQQAGCRAKLLQSEAQVHVAELQS